MSRLYDPTPYRKSGSVWGRHRPPADAPAGPFRTDPIAWPYPPESFWNMPIGQSAVLQDLGFTYTFGSSNNQSRISILEENILFLDPDAPLGNVKEHNAGWTGAVRCTSRTGGNLVGNGSVSPVPQVPIAPGWMTDPYIGDRPNMSGCFLYRDGNDLKIAFETQPLHMCSDGVAVSQYLNHTWAGDSIITGGKGPHPSRTGQSWDVPGQPLSWGQGGSHGGSYLSSFGGTIRLGEMVPGGEIPHALKVTMDTGWWCADQTTQEACYRWPALRADNGAVNGYGNLNPNEAQLPNGAKMGMLLTVPAAFNVEGLRTEPGRILGRAVQRYGAYLCDGNHNAPNNYEVQWQCERSNQGSFDTEFFNTWGYRFFHKNAIHGTPSAGQLDWRHDVGDICNAFHVVDDNSVTNVGGAGTRRWAMAPPFHSSIIP